MRSQQIRYRHIAPCFIGAIGAILMSSCQTPLGNSESRTQLRRGIDRSLERELGLLQDPTPAMDLILLESPTEKRLADRAQELRDLGPAVGDEKKPESLGPDLTGAAQADLSVSLEQTISSAVVNNLGVLGSRFGPAISRQDVIAAEAAFDALVFASADFNKIDQPATVPVINGIPVGNPIQASDRYRFETGLRKRFTSGGALSLSTDLNRSENNAPGIEFTPDPAFASAARLRAEQPLLRGFGSDVNRAAIRLAENQQDRSVQALHAELLAVIRDAERAYWDLAVAWEDLTIQQWLLDVGLGVRDVLQTRFDAQLDVRPAELSDAIARVEQRQAEVIRARRAVRAASDELKRLMNDDRAPAGSEVVLRPTERPMSAPFTWNLADAIRTAIARRPEVKQALLNIDDASIRQLVADNARLPSLNLTGEIVFQGLDDAAGSSYSNLGDADFINYAAGLAFEWPLGNREADALFTQARLRRTQSLVAYRQTVQLVIIEVKTSLRDVITNVELMAATRSARLAAAENLRTLNVQKQTMAKLTPEFLNLEFQRQESLAATQREEIAALANYSKALAALHRAMGTGLSAHGIRLETYAEPPAWTVGELDHAADSAAN